MAYTASIADALKLVQPGVVKSLNQSYFFANAMPWFWKGEDLKILSSSPSLSTSYVMNSTHFVPVSSTIQDIFSKQFIFLQNTTGIIFTDGSGLGSRIVIGGLSQQLFKVGGAPGGFATDPPLLTAEPGSRDFRRGSDIWLLPAASSSEAYLYNTVAHELGHAIGLRHSSDAGWEAAAENTRYSIMSYNEHFGERRLVTEFQLYDIAALQFLYGRDDNFNSTDTVYDSFLEKLVPFDKQARAFSIWDGGGKDTIDARDMASAALIDLRPGHFSSIGPQSNVKLMNGPQPSVDNEGKLNVSIAFGAYIENATGTAFDDLIIGNILTNVIEGGDGDDIIFGEGIAAIHQPGDGEYARIARNDADGAPPPAFVKNFIDDPQRQVDRLNGSAGDDYIYGSRGGDVLVGGQGDDRLIGGGGGGVDAAGLNRRTDIFRGEEGNDFIDATAGSWATVFWRIGDGLDTIRTDYGAVRPEEVTLGTFSEYWDSEVDARGVSTIRFVNLAMENAELVLKNLTLIDQSTENGLTSYLYTAEVWILEQGTGQGINLGLSVIYNAQDPIEISDTYLHIPLLPDVYFMNGMLELQEGGPNIAFRVESGASASKDVGSDGHVGPAVHLHQLLDDIGETTNFPNDYLHGFGSGLGQHDFVLA